MNDFFSSSVNKTESDLDDWVLGWVIFCDNINIKSREYY